MIGTLQRKGMLWCLGAALTGLLAAWLWASSQSAWQAHRDRSFVTGVELYETIMRDASAPDGIVITRLTPDETAVSPDTSPARTTLGLVTTVSVFTAPEAPRSGARLQFDIVSPDLIYPVSSLEPANPMRPALMVGNLTRLLSSYCTDPVVYARLDRGDWLHIDGSAVWGCVAAPHDLRLTAIVVFVIGLLICLSQVMETASHFTEFVSELKQRSRFGNHDLLTESGPEELRDIARTVNDFLEIERDRLQKRAMVLSGVSHDLGTPATRLRLRAALINDDELRTKLETDIDQMTGMIESVLTYTRAEMSAEEAVELSLTSLIQSIVADYEDIGKLVDYREHQVSTIKRTRSVFGGSGKLSLSHEGTRRVLVTARPISLRRAVSNLIDNSLKYGRRATVSIEADSATATIIVEDESTDISGEMLDSLTGPFLRGENAGVVDGSGLGLTIVSTIARQHGGALHFERFPSGLRANMTISRR